MLFWVVVSVEYCFAVTRLYFVTNVSRYKQAAFCYEELILAQPTNAIYHLSYAEASKWFWYLFLVQGGLNSKLLFNCVIHFPLTPWSYGISLAWLSVSKRSSAAIKQVSFNIYVYLKSTPDFQFVSSPELDYYMTCDWKNGNAHLICFNKLVTMMQLLYTIGGIDNLRIARKYYSAAIELSGGQNLRALYGVCLVQTSFHILLNGFMFQYMHSIICKQFDLGFLHDSFVKNQYNYMNVHTRHVWCENCIHGSVELLLIRQRGVDVPRRRARSWSL